MRDKCGDVSGTFREAKAVFTCLMLWVSVAWKQIDDLESEETGRGSETDRFSLTMRQT